MFTPKIPLDPTSPFLRQVPSREEILKHCEIDAKLAELCLRAFFRDVAKSVTPWSLSEIAHTVDQKYAQILAVAKMGPKERSRATIYARETLRARNEIANGLVRAREKLKTLKKKITELKKEITGLNREINEKGVKLAQQHERLLGLFKAESTVFPLPPPPSIEVSFSKEMPLPSSSGVYFLWLDGCIDYVGQSVSLIARLRPSHGVLREEHMISYLRFSTADLDFAESYYIGVLRPPRNFAKRQALHREQAVREG
jgi:hypothetical protein